MKYVTRTKDITLENLNKYHELGLLSKRSHPILPITIWNYTPKVQFEGLWDNITLTCRGLVTEIKGDSIRIIARPFKKFFNIEENRYTPTTNYSIWEKMDGSLSILFYYGKDWIICTKGSFTSDQAYKSREILHTRYKDSLSKLDKEKTFLFEIIYPANRIVVDYGQREDLFLLGVIDTHSGEEEDLSNYCSIHKYEQEIGLTMVKHYNNSLRGSNSYKALKDIVSDNQEGFIVRFSNGDRIKIKGNEYIRLHKIMTAFSTISIWECLSSDKPLESILHNVPDEFYTKVSFYACGLRNSYRSIEFRALHKYYNILFSMGVIKDVLPYDDKDLCIGDINCLWDNKEVNIYRKEFSSYANLYNNSSILYKMLDSRDYSSIIWKLIKPEYSIVG